MFWIFFRGWKAAGKCSETRATIGARRLPPFVVAIKVEAQAITPAFLEFTVAHNKALIDGAFRDDSLTMGTLPVVAGFVSFCPR